MLKGREKLAGQKKLFCQSAWLALTSFSACAWCKGASLLCQAHQLHGKRFGSNLGTDCPVSLLSGLWWGMTPPVVSQVTVLLWEAPSSAASLLRFSRTRYSVLCLTSSSLTSKSNHMYKSIFLAMSWHGGSRLAWMSTVVLAVVFFSRGDETAFWYILSVWMQWWPYQHHLELFFWITWSQERRGTGIRGAQLFRWMIPPPSMSDTPAYFYPNFWVWFVF